MKRATARAWGAVLALAGLPAASADVLCLKDGRILDGRPMKRVEGGVQIDFENGEILVPAELVVEVLIEGEPEFVPRTDEEREMLAKGLVPFEGRWLSPKRREELISKRLAERRLALEDLRAHREWRNRHQEETKNFRFQYTVPRYVFEEYRDKMEAYFQVFAKDWKIKTSPKNKLNVCFYGDRKEFQRTSGAGPWVLGYFKFVGEYDLNIYFDRLDPAETEDVMFHEANHYLQKLINEDFSYPHWPGEALAEYYGASEWDPEKKALHTGLIQEGRLIEVKADIDRGEWIGLRQLITTEGMYEHYNWGWTLVHFLMNDPEHAKKFQRFFIGLAGGRDVQREDQGVAGLQTVSGEQVFAAFRDYLGLKTDEDVRALEAAWHAHVEGLRNATTGGLEKAALAAMREGRNLRARRLFQEAIDGGTQNAFTFHKFGEMLLGDGEAAAAVEQWKRAIALDPLTGDYYLAMARALKASDAKESERLTALAKEIDPEAGFSAWWD